MPIFIAEVSSNHSRDLGRCFEFIDRAAAVGCHAVKFQLFRVDELFSVEALAAKPELVRRKDWELPLQFLPELAERCRQKKVKFSCTPFYLEAVRQLAPYVDFYKVASYELLWDSLLSACAATGKPVILSTGMATMDEITHAVRILRQSGCAEPVLLHCTSAYPTPYDQANLTAIETLRKATNCRIGWSDHTVDPGVISRAVHRWGAEFIEFHLDLDGKGEEFATGHCWLPDQIGKLIEGIGRGLVADGNGIKEPVAAELPDRLWRADPSDGLRPLLQTRRELDSRR
jgi:sialic acid synthase SpsE